MKTAAKPSSADDKGIYHAPWEKAFDRVLTPFEEFIHRQTTSGLLLMSTAILALLLANGPLAYLYYQIQHLEIGLSIGSWSLENNLHHWINDGLMALFFFVVGLELKREIMVGELANPRQAALPIIAAIGGMVVPALIYFAINPHGDAARGWGIPMATDIAFALGAIALLAGRVPRALITFLVALAIVDDLGAVIVIAAFYTETLSMGWLMTSGIFFSLLIVLNVAGIRKITPYFIIAVFLWYALFESGVHATLAGVLGAFSIPARPKYDPSRFSAQVKESIAQFDASHVPGQSIMTNDKLRGIVHSLESGALQVQTPLQRLEHAWHLPVAYLVIPVFALFNAGIPLDFSSIGATLTHPDHPRCVHGPDPRQGTRDLGFQLAGDQSRDRTLAGRHPLQPDHRCLVAGRHWLHHVHLHCRAGLCTPAGNAADGQDRHSVCLAVCGCCRIYLVIPCRQPGLT